jgi:hypothetical protein
MRLDVLEVWLQVLGVARGFWQVAALWRMESMWSGLRVF